MGRLQQNERGRGSKHHNRRVRSGEQNGGHSPPALSSSAHPGGDGLALSWLGRIHPPSSDDDVRRGEEDGDGGDDGEGREGDEAEPVDHHRRELHAQCKDRKGGKEGRGNGKSVFGRRAILHHFNITGYSDSISTEKDFDGHRRQNIDKMPVPSSP